MSLDDWLLALHLLAAFALVGGMLGLWAVILAARSADRPSGVLGCLRLVRPLNAVSGAGAIGTLVLGVWLAISIDAYEVWDGWVIAAIVLWLVAGAAGDRAGRDYAEVAARAQELAAGSDEPDAGLRAMARAPRGLALHAVATAAVLLILADMIWKPGA